MKTIQFILSFIFVAVLASCSADNDVLNEMEDHNQLPSDENVTVTLSLATDNVVTKSITSGDVNDADEVKGEDAIDNKVILVIGENGVLLARYEDEANSYELTVKKQKLNVYAIANFEADDKSAFTASTCTSYKPETFDYTKLSKTSASKLPKSAASENIEAGTEKISITFKQLTARVDEPAFTTGYTYKSSQYVKGGDVSFPLYVYPTEELSINVTGTYRDKKDYSFGPFKIGDVKVEANSIYKLRINASEPDMPAALWIDWYVVPMIEKTINPDPVGEKE